MDNKIYYHLPGLFEKFKFYSFFIPFIKEESEKIYDNVEIGSIYGSPSKAIWNGGRQAIDDQTNYPYDVKYFYDFYKIPIAFTFTNCLLESRHLNDNYCNFLMKVFNNSRNYVIVNSEILEEYIKQNYPNYRLESSTTKCITDITTLNQELLKDYELITLDYNFNKNFQLLEQISNKEKCKLLVNPVCRANCPRRAEHYEAISRVQLFEYDDTLEYDFNETCLDQTANFWEVQKKPMFISQQDIQNIYLPLGFNHFKIEGRTLPDWDLIEILLYYLVKPEYQLEIRENIFKAFCKTQWELNL